MLSDVVVLAAKDLRIELRSPSSAIGAITLGLIGLVVTGLATGPDPARLRAIAPGLGWLAVLYAAIAVSERLDRVDRSDDALSDLWLSVRDRRAIFAGKVVALTLILWTITLALLVAAIILLNVEPTLAAVGLVPLAGLASFALAAGTGLVTAVVGSSSQRVLLLPVVLLPLLAPTLLAASQATAALLAGHPDTALPWSGLLAAQAALFAGLGLLVYEVGAALE